MSQNRLIAVSSIASFVFTVVVNTLANALPINSQQTGEISNRFDVLFVPANYVFSIWGVIYLGLGAFVVYRALPSQRNNRRLQRIGWLFTLTNLANSAWIFLWHYEYFALTVVVMVGLLLMLIAIYLRLGIGQQATNRVERWVVDGPFSLYLGWITVATITNVTSYLDFVAWDGWGISPAAWTVMLLMVGVGIAAAIAFRHRDTVYLTVLVWAFAGIAVKQVAEPVVVVSASAAAILVTFLIHLVVTWPSSIFAVNMDKN